MMNTTMRTRQNPIKRLLIILALVPCGVYQLSAQSTEDLLRIASYNDMAGARGASLGSSFMGIADDASTVLLNPAGLSLIGHQEISAAFGMYRTNAVTNYLGNSTSIDAHEIMPDYLSYANSFRAGSKRAGYAFALNYDESLRSDYSFQGFNAYSSIVPTMLTQSSTDLTNNLLYQTYVADLDSTKKKLFSPIVDSMYQRGAVVQSGGRGSFGFGLGVDISTTLSFGVVLGGRWTDYSYARSYSETDNTNKYNSYDTVVPRKNTDISKIEVVDHLHQVSNAFYIRFSLMAKVEDWGRISISLAPPMSHHVSEDYSRAVAAYYDPKPDSAYTDGFEYRNDYSFSSPWDLGIAGSVKVSGLTLAAALRYRDYSSARYDVQGSFFSYYNSLNDSLASQLQEQLEWSLGAEYHPENFPIAVRASIDRLGSAYVARIADASQTMSAFGLGIFADKHLRIDLSARFSSTNGSYSVYGDGAFASYVLDQKPSQYVLQCSYRF